MRKPMKIRQNTRPQNRGPINKKEAGMSGLLLFYLIVQLLVR